MSVTLSVCQLKLKVGVLLTAVQAFKTKWRTVRDRKLWLTEEGKLYH